MSLCRACRNAQAIKNERGSVFMLCKLAKTDPRFNKYPPQPVLRCPGFISIQPIEKAR